MAYILALKAPEERSMGLYMMNYMPGGACKRILDLVDLLSDLVTTLNSFFWLRSWTWNRTLLVLFKYRLNINRSLPFWVSQEGMIKLTETMNHKQTHKLVIIYWLVGPRIGGSASKLQTLYYLLPYQLEHLPRRLFFWGVPKWALNWNRLLFEYRLLLWPQGSKVGL